MVGRVNKRTWKILSAVGAVALAAVAISATDSFADTPAAKAPRPAAEAAADAAAGQAEGFAGRLSVPPELVPPAGNVLTSVFKARGVQNYGCTAAGAWTLNEPAAVLTGIELRPVKRVTAIHFRGPSWQSDTDGTLVEGQNPVWAPSDKPNSIPQLLIQAKRTTGEGTFGGVTYVQRLATAGGVAPAGGCTEGQTKAVLYTAVYRFFKKS